MRAAGPPPRRTIYTFHGTEEGGLLAMQSFEDAATLGPDGEAGVLSLSWQQLPPKLPWSGWTYLGGVAAEERMILPQLKQVKAADDLRGLHLKFRFKGVNQRHEMPVTFNVNCRLEPLLPDSFVRRLELGNLTVTGDWGTFDMHLVDGKNTEAFLRAINDENPPQFKVVWAQIGQLANYNSGDTLLIDDLAVTMEIPK
jgi:hypothetical protein